MREPFFIMIMFTFISLSGCIFTPPAEKDTVIWNNDTIKSAKNPIIDIAQEQLGVAYRYGGSDPSGFDCSGFISYVYKKAKGIKLPRRAQEQSQYVTIMDKEDLLPGDLLFFDTANRDAINHVGIYLGEGKFIHASSGKVYSVTISTLESGFYKSKFRWGGRVE